VNRRWLICGAAPVLGALALWPRMASLLWHGAPVPRAAGQLTGILRNPVSAARVGRAYLWQHPAEARLARLIEGLVAEWDDADGWLEGAGPGEIRSRLGAQIRADFAARRTVSVQGWVLARSEARLFGLAALRGGSIAPC